jgi:hypothetical protein
MKIQENKICFITVFLDDRDSHPIKQFHLCLQVSWQLNLTSSGVGLSYYDALTGEDGTLAPMAKECERHENGMTTAGGKPPEPKTPATPLPIAKPDPEMEKMMKAMAAMPRDCTGQISTGTFAYITEIKPRRLVVADVQKGLAVGFSMFYHDGSLKTMKIKGVPGLDSMPGFAGQFNLSALHFYKIRNGKIYEIEAIGAALPYEASSGWEYK